MEQGRQEAVEQAGVEGSVEVGVVVAGWEVTVPALDLAGNASALIVGHAYHIRLATPAITGAVLNAERKW